MRTPLFFLLTFSLLFSLSGKEFRNVAKELQDRSRKTKMEKELEFAITDREDFLEMGLERKTINPYEEKKIRNALGKLRNLQRSMREKGSLSAKELKKFREELAYCYHLIYFASRKEGEFTYTLEGGQKFYLLPEYQRRADRGALSRKDMREIHIVMNRVWRLRARLKNRSFPQSERKQLLEECKFLLLEKYFTETKPEKKLSSGKNKKQGVKK